MSALVLAGKPARDEYLRRIAMPRRQMTIYRLALLLGTTALMSLSADRAQAACFYLGGVDYQCTGASGGTTIVGAPGANVLIGDFGTDSNATFSPGLTITGTAINVTFATTTTPSSFSGSGGLRLDQSGPTSDNLSITGMNAVINLTSGIGIEVNADTSGITTIETVAGGTITTSGNGLEYRNVNITPGTLNITVGAAISAGANNSALLIDTGGSSTLNVNANLQGAITYSGRTTGTVVINIGAGVTVSPTGIYQTIALNNVSDATVNNAGTIVAGASALYTNSNTTLNNQASGTISASATGYAFRQHGSGKTLTVDNAGTIVGTGFSVAGSTVAVTNSGTWTANAASAFTGTATLANSGTFVSGAFTTALTSVTNSGSVNIQAGGTLSTTGGYNQSAGGTAIDGTLQGNVTLNGGQILGTGTIAGNLTANSGATVSPGGSTGTLAVTGNATFNAGSIYKVEIVGATSDLLTVSGTASLGGTIQVVAGGGSYSFNAPYTVLTATGGRTGAFASVTNTFGVGVTTEVSYGASDVKITLKPASLVDAGSNSGSSGPPQPSGNPVYAANSGLSLNSWSVAAAIDRAVANGADPSFLYQVYARADREALIGALRTLTGEIHSATGTLGLFAASGFLNAALDPFAAGRDPNAMPNAFGAFATAGSYASSGSAADLPSTKGNAVAPRFVPDRLYTVWGQVFGSVGKSDGDRTLGTTGQNGSSGHIALGVDLRVLPDTIIGAAIAAGEARTTLSGQLGSAKAEVLQTGLYGMTRIGALSLGAAVGYASADTETTRAIPLLGVVAAKGDHRASIWSGRAEAAYRIASVGPLAFSPYGAFTAQSLHTPAFLERDGVTGLPTGLAVDSRSATISRAELGLRLDAITTLFGVRATAFGKLGWGYYAQRDARFSASFIGLPGSGFSFDGARPDRNAALISAGLDIRFSPAVSLGARFDSELSQNAQSYAGAATLKVSF